MRNPFYPNVQEKRLFRPRPSRHARRCQSLVKTVHTLKLVNWNVKYNLIVRSWCSKSSDNRPYRRRMQQKSYEGRINSAIKSHVTRIVTDHNNVGARFPIVSLLRTFILFVIFYALVWICTDTWKDYILDYYYIFVSWTFFYWCTRKAKCTKTLIRSNFRFMWVVKLANKYRPGHEEWPRDRLQLSVDTTQSPQVMKLFTYTDAAKQVRAPNTPLSWSAK